MELKEFLSTNKRKIIICDTVSTTNKLFRRLNIQDDFPILDAQNTTVKEIAKAIYYSYQAYNSLEPVRYLEDNEGNVMLINHFDNNENKYKSIPVECLNKKTFSMIYKSINQVRTSKVIKNIDDINNIIENYERYIEKEKCIDAPLLLKKVNDILGNEDAIKYLEYNNDVVFGLLDGTKLTYIEQCILDKIVRLLNTKYEHIEYLEENNINETFAKTYGTFNEVKYAIKNIKDNKYLYGDVEILYTTYEYENYLRAILEDEKIPFRMVGNTHASSTNFITYLLDLCHFIQNDYKYIDLQKVVNNPIAVLPESDVDIVKAFNTFANESAVEQKDRYNLMADRIRNSQFEHVRDVEKYMDYATFLDDLTTIINDNDSNVQTFNRLINFSTNYSKRKNQEVSSLIPHFESIGRELELRNKLDKETLLKEIVGNLENLYYKEIEDCGSINCRYFSNTNVVDRKHLFILGLSANSLMQKEIESAILDDEKITECLENINDSLVFGCKANKDYIDKLNRTINSMTNGDIHYVYSYYNTVDLIEESPSVFYLDKKKDKHEEEFKYEPLNKSVIINEKDLFEYLTGEASEDVISNGALSDLEYDYIYKHYDVINQIDKETKVVADTKKELKDNTNEKSISPSALATLTECPLKFYYQYIKYLENVELKETDPSSWLDYAQTGKFFHRVMEIYMREEFSIAKKNSIFNEKLYEEAFNVAKEEAEISMPILNEKVYEKELENLDKKLRNSIEDNIKTFNDMNNKYPCIVIGTEIGFGKGSVKTIYTSEKGYTLSFNGSIDRLDGYLDENNILHIRVLDYKTGKKEKLKGKLKENLTFQHIIYPLAGVNYIKDNKKEIEARFGVSIKDAIVAASDYYMVEDYSILPGITEVNKYLRKGNNAFEYNLETLPTNIINILDITENLRQNNKMIDISAEIEQYFGKFNNIDINARGDDKNICNYCKYSKVCRKRLNWEGKEKGWKLISEK